MFFIYHCKTKQNQWAADGWEAGCPSGRREGPGLGGFPGSISHFNGLRIPRGGDWQGLFPVCQRNSNLPRPCGFGKLEADVRAETL